MTDMERGIALGMAILIFILTFAGWAFGSDEYRGRFGSGLCLGMVFFAASTWGWWVHH